MTTKLPLLLLGMVLASTYSFTQNNQIEKADSYYKKSVSFEATNIDSSLVYAHKAYGLLNPKDTLNGVFGDILNQYGRLYYYKKDYHKAYDYFKRCHLIALETNQIADAYKVKVNMAVCQRQLNNTKGALEELYQVVAYYEKNKADDLNLGKTYVNIADLYMLNRKHEFAETYYKKSEPFFKASRNLLLQLQGNRIANFNSFDPTKSLEIIKVIESDKALDSVPTFVSAPIFNGMAQTMVKTENLKKGLFYTLKAIGIKKKSGVIKGIAIQYNNVGDIYIKTSNYPMAIIYLDSALLKATTARQKFEILKNLQKAHKANSNLERSLFYANKYIELKDSVNEVLTQKEIAELGIKYQTTKQNEFIHQLQNLSLIYKGAILILLVFGLYISATFFKKNKIQKKELKILQKEFGLFKEKQARLKKNISNDLIHLKSKAVISIKDLLYVKSDGHYVEYYLEDKPKPEIDRNSLNSVLTQLPEASFFRIHKSHIVNIHRIKIINSTKVMLDNGVWINLSRTYKQALKDVLHKGLT